jgi:hypothetical protein
MFMSASTLIRLTTAGPISVGKREYIVERSIDAVSDPDARVLGRRCGCLRRGRGRLFAIGLGLPAACDETRGAEPTSSTA